MAENGPTAEAVQTIPRSRSHTPAAAPPLIGIVTHELRGEAEPAWAPALGRRERDLAPHRLSLRLTYTQAVQEAGGLAVVVPTHGFVDETAALLDRLDGLVFSGGPDLDPAVYGQARHAKLGPDDATIEAVWDPAARFCLGIQWHGELLTHHAEHAPLFERLVAAARGGAPSLALAA